MSACQRFVSSVLIASTLAMGMPNMASADIVTTQETLSTEQSIEQRSKVNTFFNRADVRQALEDKGISSESALERVNAMSDSEVSQLAKRIDQTPAGGEVLGLLFTIFIVLLVTDILGLTKIFPFTRSIK